MITIRRGTTSHSVTPEIYNTLNRTYASMQPVGQTRPTAYAIRQPRRRPTTSFASQREAPSGIQIANLRNRGGRMDRYGTSFTESQADQAATDALEPGDFGMQGSSFKTKLPRRVLNQALSPALIAELRRRGANTNDTGSVVETLQEMKSQIGSDIQSAGSHVLPVAKTAAVYGAAGALTGLSKLASAVDYGLNKFDQWMRSGEDIEQFEQIAPPAPPPPVPAEEISKFEQAMKTALPETPPLRISTPPTIAAPTPPMSAQSFLLNQFMSPASLESDYDPWEQSVSMPKFEKPKFEKPEYRYYIRSYNMQHFSLRVIDTKTGKTKPLNVNMIDDLDWKFESPESRDYFKTSAKGAKEAATKYVGGFL